MKYILSCVVLGSRDLCREQILYINAQRHHLSCLAQNCDLQASGCCFLYGTLNTACYHSNFFVNLCKYFFFFFSDYLLSNNYVNSIIVHKFDFSDEEIMAYYISFLKTLSLKLNNHTVHFFYNEVSKESCSIMIRGLELEIDRSVAHTLFSLLSHSVLLLFL